MGHDRWENDHWFFASWAIHRMHCSRYLNLFRQSNFFVLYKSSKYDIECTKPTQELFFFKGCTHFNAYILICLALSVCLSMCLSIRFSFLLSLSLYLYLYIYLSSYLSQYIFYFSQETKQQLFF